MTTDSESPLTPYRPEPFKLRAGHPGPVLGVIAKNPSQPDTPKNPTFRRIIGYANRHAFGEVQVVNLFSRRAPKARTLNDLTYDDAVGPNNDDALRLWADSCDRLVCAWGNSNEIRQDYYRRRVAEVRLLLAERCLWSVDDPTIEGHPRHPLFWRLDAPLRPFAGLVQTWD